VRTATDGTQNFVRADNLYFEEELSPTTLPDSRFSMTPPSEQLNTEIIEPSRPVFTPYPVDPSSFSWHQGNDPDAMSSHTLDTVTLDGNHQEGPMAAQEMTEVSHSSIASTVVGKGKRKATQEHQNDDNNTNMDAEDPGIAKFNGRSTPEADGW
jgi:hypothetical protein